MNDDLNSIIEEIEEEEDENEDIPFMGYRFKIDGLDNRSQYIIVDTNGLMVTFPDNHMENWNYQSTATALTRIISIALQAGIEMEGIKKQLKESSMKEGDTPDVLLTAINKYEKIINEGKES